MNQRRAAAPVDHESRAEDRSERVEARERRLRIENKRRKGNAGEARERQRLTQPREPGRELRNEYEERTECELPGARMREVERSLRIVRDAESRGGEAREDQSVKETAPRGWGWVEDFVGREHDSWPCDIKLLLHPKRPGM